MPNFKTLFTSFQGRISRRDFWIGIAVMAVVAAVVQAGIFAAVNYSDVAVVSAASCVLFVYPAFALYVKRVHDLGHPASALVVLLIPIYNVIWIVRELGMKEGEDRTNAFGPAPAAA